MRTLALILGAWLAAGGISCAQEHFAPPLGGGNGPLRVVIQELEFNTFDDFPRFLNGFGTTVVHEQRRADHEIWVRDQSILAPRTKVSHPYFANRNAREIAHAELRVVLGSPASSHSRELNPSSPWELPASLYWQDVEWQARADAVPQANGRLLVDLSFERTGRESRFQIRHDSFQILEPQTLRVLSQFEIAPGDTQIVYQESGAGLLRVVAVTVECAPAPDVKSGPPSVSVPDVIAQINFAEAQPLARVGDELTSEPIQPQFAPELPRVIDAEPRAVAENQFQLSFTELVVDAEKLNRLGINWPQLLELRERTKPRADGPSQLGGMIGRDFEMAAYFQAMVSSGMASVVGEPSFEVPDGRPGELRVETMVPFPQPGENGQFAFGGKPIGLRINCTASSLNDDRVRVNLDYEHSRADLANSVNVQGHMVPGFSIFHINTASELELGQTWVAACLPFREEEKTKWRLIAVTPRRLDSVAVVEQASHVPGLYAVPNPPEMHFESAQPDSAPGVVWLGPVEPLHLPAVEMLDAEPIPLPPVRLVSESEEGSVHISGFDPELDAEPVAVRFRAPLPSLAVNLNEEKMNRYLRVSIVLHTEATPQQQAVLTHALARQELEIRDALVSLLSDKTVEQVRGRAGIDTLREEVRGTINRVLGTEGAPEISRVLFVDFAVQ